MIVGALEQVAREAGATSLWLDASLTAEPFYRALSYREIGRGEHRLGSGVLIACVTMTKPL